MNQENTQYTPVSGLKKPLRLTAGIIIVIVQWLIWLALPNIIPGTFAIAVMGGVACSLAVIIWWAFFSRAPVFDRISAILFMVILMIILPRLLHESIATGMQGMMFVAYTMPVFCLTLVAWAYLSRKQDNRVRRVSMFATVFAGCCFLLLLRSEGITGSGGADFKWRWTVSFEEEFLAKATAENPAYKAVKETIATSASWPGFRGPDRNNVIRNLTIATDWKQSPPIELWRKPVGPGCSSFAVMGNLVYTQEQLGEKELVTCYTLDSGEPVWKHEDDERFWDSHAGAGPRSTPALHNGRVYTMGATGVLNVLDAFDGTLIWSHNVANDKEVVSPGWGFTSSPLVVDSVVVVSVSGVCCAYDCHTGALLWHGKNGGESYSSPHLVEFEGTRQVLMLNKSGVTSYVPATGTVLWEHPWNNVRIVQPALTSDGDLLVVGESNGIKRLGVSKGSGDWNIEERWTSNSLKPDFVDFVVHKGLAYGYSGPHLVCIDLEDGHRHWRGGRYGGQILLLADQDLLLILSEKGDLTLVEASPDKFNELAKYKAIEGKTWNHPVLVNDIILVRNSLEMAAFRLPS